MSYLSESWDPAAHTLGYKDEREMLVDLYVNQKYSITDLATRLGYSRNNIRKRLSLLGVKFRGRGGRNNVQSFLHSVSDEELKNPAAVAKKHDVHISTVYLEQRRRAQCNLQSLPEPPGTSDTPGEAPTSASPSGSETTKTTEDGTTSDSLLENLLSSITEPTKE